MADQEKKKLNVEELDNVAGGVDYIDGTRIPMDKDCIESARQLIRICRQDPSLPENQKEFVIRANRGTGFQNYLRDHWDDPDLG